MAWFLLARALFVLAVMYAAVFVTPSVQRPLRSTSLPALALGLLIVVVETRLRDGGGHRPARRAHRWRHRPGPREDDRRGALLGGHHRSARRVPCTASSCWSSPISGSSWVRGRGSGSSRRGSSACSATPVRSVAIDCSTPASSSTAGLLTSARPASSTARSSSRSSCSRSCSSSPTRRTRSSAIAAAAASTSCRRSRRWRASTS